MGGGDGGLRGIMESGGEGGGEKVFFGWFLGLCGQLGYGRGIGLGNGDWEDRIVMGGDCSARIAVGKLWCRKVR